MVLAEHRGIARPIDAWSTNRSLRSCGARRATRNARDFVDWRTTVVDPWGDVLLDMGEAGGLGLVDIDLTRLGDVRARVPAIANRRAIPQEVQIS